MSHPNFTFPPPYLRKIQYWEDIPETFHPNALLLIDQRLQIHEFHQDSVKMRLKKSPNAYTTALDIGFVFVTFFNLLHLPSDVLEYRGSPVDIGTYEILDGTLLYPEKLEKETISLIEKHSKTNFWGKDYYSIQIHPFRIDFSMLNEFWSKFSDYLLKSESFPYLDMACRRLYRSFNNPDPEDILLELVIGLEALFCLRGRSHTKTFSTSISKMTPLRNRDEVRVFAESLYNIRSRIVHGDPFTEELEDPYWSSSSVKNFTDLIFKTRKTLILGIIDYMTLLGTYQNKTGIV